MENILKKVGKVFFSNVGGEYDFQEGSVQTIWEPMEQSTLNVRLDLEIDKEELLDLIEYVYKNKLEEVFENLDMELEESEGELDEGEELDDFEIFIPAFITDVMMLEDYTDDFSDYWLDELREHIDMDMFEAFYLDRYHEYKEEDGKIKVEVEYC